jgi:hypothetical protein
MLEANSRLYVDEHSGVKSIGLGKVRAIVSRLIMIAAKAAGNRT